MNDPRGFARPLSPAADVTYALIDRVLGTRAPWAKRGDGDSVVIGWIISRAVMIMLFWFFEFGTMNDVNYYFTNLNTASTLGVGYALPEYPLPVAALLALPYVLSFGNIVAYRVGFVVMMLLVDALFTRQLYVHQGRRNTAPVTLWLAAAPLLGPLMITRFDLIPGVLVAASLLWLQSKPHRSGAAIALGTGIKLWPILVLPAIAAPLHSRLRVIIGSLVTAAVLITASLAIGGWDRFISPLRYQTDRGLQIEAPISWPLMAAWAIHKAPWIVFFSEKSHSVEVSGPGASFLLALATLLTLLALITIAAFSLRAWRAQNSITPSAIALIAFTSVGTIILTNKVFSPQYIQWLVPIAVAALALTPGDISMREADDDPAIEHDDLALRRAVTSLLIVGLLTHMIYPRLYNWVSQSQPTNPLGVVLLLIRDLGLAYVVYYFGRRAWQASARRPHESDTGRVEQHDTSPAVD